MGIFIIHLCDPNVLEDRPHLSHIGSMGLGIFTYIYHTSQLNVGHIYHISKKTPTDPWNIPQNPQLPVDEGNPVIFTFFGIPGVCSRDLLDFS